MASNVQTTTITIGGEVSKSLKDAFSFANDGIKRLGTEVTLLDRRLARMSTTSKEYARMRTQVDALRASQVALESIEAKRDANLEKRGKLGSAFGEARGTLGTAVTALAKPVENAPASPARTSRSAWQPTSAAPRSAHWGRPSWNSRVQPTRAPTRCSARSG